MREWLIRKLGGVDAERCDRLSDEVRARNDELIDLRADLAAAVDAELKAQQTIAELREILEKFQDEATGLRKTNAEWRRLVEEASLLLRTPPCDLTARRQARQSGAEFARGFESMSDAEGLAGMRDGLR